LERERENCIFLPNVAAKHHLHVIVAMEELVIACVSESFDFSKKLVHRKLDFKI
jgi:hypothetical protein